jgi:hypothetical protein
MKIAIVLSSLLLSSSGFAANSTTMKVTQSASKADVRSALSDLVAALKGEEGSADYNKSLKSASEKIQSKKEIKTYAAALMCEGVNVIAEAIEVEEGVGGSGNCDLGTICYDGKLATSLSLLKAAMAQDLFNWDETWFEKARVKSQTIQVDYVDGPSELRETLTFKACK